LDAVKAIDSTYVNDGALADGVVITPIGDGLSSVAKN
jgi:hypothetical protein